MKDATPRTAEQVARRALVLELVAQRIAIEAQAAELGDEATEAQQGLAHAIERLALDEALHGAEKRLLGAPVGAIDLEDPLLNLVYADLTYLLWSLGRVERIPSVDELEGSELPDVLARGIFAESDGDLDAAASIVARAKLRPREELEATLLDIAKANALLAASGPGPHTDVPPATVFYVMPWLLSQDWPWQLQCGLQYTDGEITGLQLSSEGLGSAGE